MIRRYGNVVTPVYIQRHSGNLEHEGSAVLVQSTEGYWVFTAAHVLAQKAHHQILLPGRPDFFTPTGDMVSSCELLPEIAEKDRVDMSYFRLTDDEAQRLRDSGAHFLQASEETLEPSGATPFPGVGTISGFPEKSVLITGRQAEVHPTDLLEMEFASPERLSKAGFDPALTIGLIRPQKLWLNGERLFDFQLKGLSGGAIWSHDGDRIRLVGVFTEYHSTRSLMIGTRIKPLIAELVRRLRQSEVT